MFIFILFVSYINDIFIRNSLLEENGQDFFLEENGI